MQSHVYRWVELVWRFQRAYIQQVTGRISATVTVYDCMVWFRRQVSLSVHEWHDGLWTRIATDKSYNVACAAGLLKGTVSCITGASVWISSYVWFNPLRRGTTNIRFGFAAKIFAARRHRSGYRWVTGRRTPEDCSKDVYVAAGGGV